jgi:hypothetical protein
MDETPEEEGPTGSGGDDVASQPAPEPTRPAKRGWRLDRENAPDSRWRSPDEPCPNCGDPTPGRFCPACGQRKTMVQVSVGTIVGEVLKDELALNSALPRTVVGILFRPGFLTNEYIRGRIVRYIPPLRLYLIASILFFLVLSLVSLRALDRANIPVRGAAALAEGADRDSAIAELRTQRLNLLQAEPDEAGPVRIVIRQALLRTEASLQALGDTVTPTVRPGPELPGRVDALAPGSLQPWAVEIRQNVQRGFLRRPVERKLAQIGHLPPVEALRAFMQDMLEYAPHMMFVLLPVFALILKLLYVRRDRFYAEHFVFALHVHAFLFLMFFIILVLPLGRLVPYLTLWMLIYLWLAMKRVYRQGWFRTTVKWWVLFWTYSMLLSVGLIVLALSTIFIG